MAKKNDKLAWSAKLVKIEEYTPTVATRKTPPYMSQYEYSALILARMLQLTGPTGAPLISPTECGSYDPLVIATEEVKRRLPALVIRRTLNDGSTEDWLLNDTVCPMEFPRI